MRVRDFFQHVSMYVYLSCTGQVVQLLTFFSLHESVRSLEVKLGIDDLLDITVSIENSMENSYNSRVILKYPAGLSYRKFTALQVRHQDQVSFMYFCSTALFNEMTILWDVCFIYFFFKKREELSATPLTVTTIIQEGRRTALLTSQFSRATIRWALCTRSPQAVQRAGNLTTHHFWKMFRHSSLSPMGLEVIVNLTERFFSLQTLPGTAYLHRTITCRHAVTSQFLQIIEFLF